MSLGLSISCMMAVTLLACYSAFRGSNIKPVDQKYIIPLKIECKRKPKTKVKKPTMDSKQTAAKIQLVSFGFSATEAKKMLEGIRASTVEQYIQEAMRNVKI